MIEACPLCGRSAFAAKRFGLLGCEHCALVVAAAVWQPDANAQLNDASFGEAYRPVSSFWVRGFEASSNRRRLRSIRRRAGLTGGELLEVGVGTGSFLTYAASQGFAPLGCDLSAAICRTVTRDTGEAVHCGSLTSLPTGTLFDVIAMHHLLEHVADPVALLQDARARLKPGGALQLAVPNADAWEARLRGWNSYEPYHLVYFTAETLRLTAELAGFTVLRVSTHESFSGWALAILRTICGYSVQAIARPPTGDAAGRSAWVEHAYRLALVTSGLITLPLRRIQAWLGRGDELILVAKNVAPTPGRTSPRTVGMMTLSS